MRVARSRDSVMAATLALQMEEEYDGRADQVRKGQKEGLESHTAIPLLANPNTAVPYLLLDAVSKDIPISV